jgi:hypothetical protein
MGIRWEAASIRLRIHWQSLVESVKGDIQMDARRIVGRIKQPFKVDHKLYIYQLSVSQIHS